MNLYGNPAVFLEKMEDEGEECKDCRFDQRVGVGRRFKCIKDGEDHPNASRSTCIDWRPKQQTKQQTSPDGAMQRRA